MLKRKQPNHSYKTNNTNNLETNTNKIYYNYKLNVKPSTRQPKELATYTSCPNITKDNKINTNNIYYNINKDHPHHQDNHKYFPITHPSKISYNKEKKINSLHLANHPNSPNSISTLPLLIQHSHTNTNKHIYNECISKINKHKIISANINHKCQTTQNENELKHNFITENNEDSFYKEFNELVNDIDKHLSREESCKKNKRLEKKEDEHKEMVVHHINNIVPSNGKRKYKDECNGKNRSVLKVQIGKGNNKENKQGMKVKIPKLFMESINKNNSSDKNIIAIKPLSERPGTSYGHIRFKSQSKLNKLIINNNSGKLE